MATSRVSGAVERIGSRKRPEEVTAPWRHGRYQSRTLPYEEGGEEKEEEMWKEEEEEKIWSGTCPFFYAGYLARHPNKACVAISIALFVIVVVSVAGKERR